jgi:hypothetical protein
MKSIGRLLILIFFAITALLASFSLLQHHRLAGAIALTFCLVVLWWGTVLIVRSGLKP